MALTVHVPRSRRPARTLPRSVTPAAEVVADVVWDHARDGAPPSELPPLRRVVVAVVLAVVTMAIGVTLYSWAVTGDGTASASVQTPIVSAAV